MKRSQRAESAIPPWECTTHPGDHVRIDDVLFSAARPEDRASGLLGFVACTANGRLRLDGITLRETADGRRVLSFPARRDRGGREHHYVRPVDDAARREIERQVFLALGLEEAPR